MKEILRKVKRLEIKIRRKVENTFAGEYHSAFKGQGLEFDEVRLYQYGDDIRSIDWNVTAKSGEVYIKKFREEREQTLFVLFDISGSEDFGIAESNKRLIGTEIASILAFSALKNNDKIGMATFTDRIEKYIRPGKGRKHILSIVKELLTHQAASRITDLHFALDFTRRNLKKRGILILISDFLDEGYERPLMQLARKHEVILIRLFHPDEIFQTGAGTVPVVDMEHQRMVWINAGDMGYRQQLNKSFSEIETRLQAFCKRYKVGYIGINTQKDYLPELERFFKRRTRIR